MPLSVPRHDRVATAVASTSHHLYGLMTVSWRSSVGTPVIRALREGLFHIVVIAALAPTTRPSHGYAARQFGGSHYAPASLLAGRSSPLALSAILALLHGSLRSPFRFEAR